MTLEQQSISAEAARILTHTTKSLPHMMGLSPQYLLRLLPWENVPGGVYRVNRTKMVLEMGNRLTITDGDPPSLSGETLRNIPLFSKLHDDLLSAMANEFKPGNFGLGQELIKEGEDRDTLFVIVGGTLELLSIGDHGEQLRVRTLTSGDFFGLEELLSDATSNVTVRALTNCRTLSLTKESLDGLLQSDAQMAAHFQESMDRMQELKSIANDFGEANVDISGGDEGEDTIHSTYIDYLFQPKEFPLSSVQTVIKLHTRVSDLYNDPMNQLQQQLRLTIGSMKERQEWEMVNNPRFGLLAQCEPFMRIPTRYGPPTPDDLDTLLALVWKQPSFFLAHPRAIVAFTRECTWRGVPPPTVEMLGQHFITWRGVPLIPSDKVEIDGKSFSLNGTGKTNFILVRVGKEMQGVIGLHQTGIPGEIAPGLSVRQMGINDQAITSYLITQYYSQAALVEDAIAVLENVEVGHHHDYANRAPKVK